MNYWVGDSNGKGRISLIPTWVRHEFMAALAGVEIERIRRCPIDDCGKFFYARPAHKGACDEHLARARVQRGRDRSVAGNTKKRGKSTGWFGRGEADR